MSRPTPAASPEAPADRPVRRADGAMPPSAVSQRPPSLRHARPRRLRLATGTAALLVAFAAVQAGGCGFKTPLELPKKAAPAKPAP